MQDTVQASNADRTSLPRDRGVHFDVAVIGLGYVGLPLAHAASSAELHVAGVDVDESRVSDLRRGIVDGKQLSYGQLDRLLRSGFTPTTDYSIVKSSDVVVICVPTPLDEAGTPNLEYIRQATLGIGPHLRAGTLVILESTTYPGTTDDVVRPILEAASGLVVGETLSLAFSPERIDPGNENYGVGNTPKVVGGFSAACTEAARAFYARFCERVVLTSGTREAEMAKLLENTYRQVNIALINEMAIFCHDLGIDLRDAIDAASTKPFGFQAFYPGPGVGGHCIPVDPVYLSYAVRQLGYPFRVAELAQEINNSMPTYVARRAQECLNDAGLAMRDSTILILGVTYKPDVADDRGAPATPLTRQLRKMGATVLFHDPYVTTLTVDGEEVKWTEDFSEADLVVLLQQHQAYDDGQLYLCRRLLDTRHAMGDARPGDHVQYL